MELRERISELRHRNLNSAKYRLMRNMVSRNCGGLAVSSEGRVGYESCFSVVAGQHQILTVKILCGSPFIARNGESRDKEREI